MLKKIIKKIVPQKIKRHLILFRDSDLDRYSIKSYSQEGEDIILRRIFENKNKGFYIDVGAHHPERFSNTFIFYKKGWHGINIDAMPGSMKLFNKLRPRDINIEKAISNKEEFLTYYIYNELAINTLNKKLAEKKDITNNYFIKNRIIIKTERLEKILDENISEKKEIDFLSIDVEGLDFEVLKSNNFDKYKPKIILMEMISWLNNNDDIYRYMEKKGYIFFAKTVNTVFFKRIK